MPGDAKGGVLPINRTMFHGTSLFEVHSSKSGGVFNADIMRLLAADAKESMRELMTKISRNAEGKEASFRCIPDNVDCMSLVRSDGSVMEAHVSRTTGKRNVDFVDWQPELPHSIGLYQAFCRGYQKDTRVHKLFIGVSGGLNRCSDEFYNLLLDVGNEFSCKDVAFSEEVWWLCKACQRARCKVALIAAEHFGLSITTARDLFSYNQDLIGVPVTDTVEFDLKEDPDGNVEFYSACVDTTAVQNGILVKMHEGEGIWMFRGAARSSAKVTSFGSLFGSKAICGLFPTRSPYYKRNQGSPCYVNGLDSELVPGCATRRSPAPSPTGLCSSLLTSNSFPTCRPCSGIATAGWWSWCPLWWGRREKSTIVKHKKHFTSHQTSFSNHTCPRSTTRLCSRSKTCWSGSTRTRCTWTRRPGGDPRRRARARPGDGSEVCGVPALPQLQPHAIYGLGRHHHLGQRELARGRDGLGHPFRRARDGG
jgi:hypothetical protein